MKNYLLLLLFVAFAAALPAQDGGRVAWETGEKKSEFKYNTKEGLPGV